MLICSLGTKANGGMGDFCVHETFLRLSPLKTMAMLEMHLRQFQATRVHSQKGLPHEGGCVGLRVPPCFSREANPALPVTIGNQVCRSYETFLLATCLGNWSTAASEPLSQVLGTKTCHKLVRPEALAVARSWADQFDCDSSDLSSGILGKTPGMS